MWHIFSFKKRRCGLWFSTKYHNQGHGYRVKITIGLCLPPKISIKRLATTMLYFFSWSLLILFFIFFDENRILFIFLRRLSLEPTKQLCMMIDKTKLTILTRFFFKPTVCSTRKNWTFLKRVLYVRVELASHLTHF